MIYFYIGAELVVIYSNKRFKISALMSYIQDCFEYIIKNHETPIDNPQLRIYVNNIENAITFKINQDIILKY